MSDKHHRWHFDDKPYMVSDSYKRWTRHTVAERDAYIIHFGWDSQFCRRMYFHTYATGGVFRNNNDCFGLACPDTFQVRCKSTHHWGLSCEHVDSQEGWKNDDRVVLNGGLVSTVNYFRSIWSVIESDCSKTCVQKHTRGRKITCKTGYHSQDMSCDPPPLQLQPNVSLAPHINQRLHSYHISCFSFVTNIPDHDSLPSLNLWYRDFYLLTKKFTQTWCWFVFRTF